MSLRLLRASEVERLLPMALAVEAAADGCRAHAIVPQRVPIELGEGESLAMPGYLPELHALGTKLVSLFPANAVRGLPASMGIMILLDASSGAPLAVLEGTFLTTLRTGAVAGAATQALARPESSRAAVLGAGGQAWHQVEAVCTVRPIRELRIWNRTPARAQQLAATVRERLGIEVRVCAGGAEAVHGADVVSCATSSPEPVLRGEWLSPGCHVNGIGSFRPDMREVDAEVVRRAARLVLDSPAATRAGDLAGVPQEALCTLGEVLRGERPGRGSPDEITFFKSVGWAALDLATAARALERAVAEGVGLEVELLDRRP